MLPFAHRFSRADRHPCRPPRLQNHTLLLLLLLPGDLLSICRCEDRSDRFVEHGLQPFLPRRMSAQPAKSCLSPLLTAQLLTPLSVSTPHALRPSFSSFVHLSYHRFDAFVGVHSTCIASKLLLLRSSLKPSIWPLTMELDLATLTSLNSPPGTSQPQPPSHTPSP